jgi:hypothetical protein
MNTRQGHFPDQLDLHKFFVGDSKAWGMVMNRWGKVQRRFRVDIAGHVDAGNLVLDERFVFDDGETDHRIWKIEHQGHNVSGQASDVFGTAGGEISGPMLQWTYDVAIRVGRRRVRVRFDDWMILADDNVMLSHAVIAKFGIRVADVFIAFRKSDTAELHRAAA